MKKTTKYIIITLVVLIVLGAAAAALILTSPKDSEGDANSSSTVSESTEPALIDKTAEDVKNIGVEDLAADDSYTIIPTETTTSSGDTEQTFTIEGWDDLDVLYSNVKSLADRLYSITPTKKIGAVEDLSEYGLGSGEGYKITMNYTDGTSQTFTIGNKAGESSGSYMLYEDEVYIVPVSTYLKQSKYDFLNKSLIAIPTPTITATDGTETDSTSEINSLHLSGQNYPEEIQFGLSDDEVLAYDITEPIYAGMNSGKIDDFVKQLQNVTAAGVLAVHATEEDIAKYGLDNPVAVCDYTMNDEHHVIKLGDKTGDLYSMMVDDDTTIYTITDSAVTSWVNIEVYSLRDGFVRLPYIKSVSRVTLTSSTGTDVYDVTRIENEEKSTETNTFYDLEVSKDGKEINYDYYQPFYQMLLAISVLNEDIQEPQGDPILTIKYDFFDGRKSEEIKFYADPASERRAVATLNDQPTGSVRMSDIQKVLEAKEVIAQNKPVKGDEEESTTSELESAAE